MNFRIDTTLIIKTSKMKDKVVKDEFGEENLPRYDDSKGDDPYDDPKNHESYKKFKKIKDLNKKNLTLWNKMD